MLLAWVVPLIAIWVRYERLSHAKHLLAAILLWPLLLLDDMLRAFDDKGVWTFLVGAFRFAPVAMIALMYFCLNRLLVEKPLSGPFKFLLPAILVFAVNIPFLMLPLGVKFELLQSPPQGGLIANWPVYASYFISAFAVLYLGLRCSQMIHDYQYHLSDQVVDIRLYKMPAALGLFSGLVSVSFGSVIITILIALAMFDFNLWQSVINLLYAGIYWLLIMVLLQRRRYSPSPLDYDVIENPKFSQTQLSNTLKKAEKAIIQYRAYKRIGLRIRHICKLADVEPTQLAVATRTILNRNFRAFIYHYRLEYAKKVLMRSDAKVASVAKRLGFNSEKFLSGMFIKYIQTMGKEDHPNEDKLF